MEKIKIEEEFNSKINEFIKFTKSNDKKLVFITSGGCSVRLEKNTVRMIENFSTGTRGALSAEYFLENDYNVIFFHRDRSNLPYIHRLDARKLMVSDEYLNSQEVKDLRALIKKYENKIIYIPFTTFDDYTDKLYVIIDKLNILGSKCMIYLAAAISDFYIPENELSEHKIQSRDDKGEHKDTLEITLYSAPKLLHTIKEKYNKESYLITFKLETDTNLLKQKAEQSLNKSKSDVVVANIMSNRYDEIHLYIRKEQITTSLAYEYELLKKKDFECEFIEKFLIKRLVELHDNHIKLYLKN